MNPISKLFQSFSITRLAIFLCSALLVSCGDSVTTAGIGGTGITSGEITGFGSVYVNGVKFNTVNSQFVVDGDIYATQEDAIRDGELSVGMVAKVYGTTDGNGVSGTATLVVYDDDIEGPVSNLSGSGNQKSFNIFNKLVHVDQYETTFRDDDFGDLADGDLVEVSGFQLSDTEIAATFVDRDGAVVAGVSIVELEGTITDYNFTAKTFQLGSVTIEFATASVIDVPGGTLDDGMLVEVEGTYEGVNSITAIEIKEEDDDFDSNVDYISLEGIIAEFTNVTDLLFIVNGQFVDASGAIFFDASENPFTPDTELYNGVRVEVEGTIVGGVLFADEVELH